MISFHWVKNQSYYWASRHNGNITSSHSVTPYKFQLVDRGVYRVLVGKPEGRRPLRRPRCRWVDNIRKDLQEVGCGFMDWIGLAQDRDRWRTLVSAVMNLRVPWSAGNFLTSCKPVSFSRRTLHHGVSKTAFEMWWYTRRNQISSFGETDESI